MHSRTISCHAVTPEKGVCDARALVHEVHYVYSPSPGGGAPGDFERVLTEIRYDIDCPKCGYRTQVEPVSPPSLNLLPSEVPPISSPIVH